MNTIIGVFNGFFESIISFLPLSPFAQFINALPEIPFLSNLNWFFPISEIIPVLEVWLSVIIVYYTYAAIMRFIRLV